MVWAQKQVYSSALADLEEAIRLDPSNDIATTQRENVQVVQIRSKLIVGLSQKEVAGYLKVLADKPKPDQSDVLLEGDRVADFKYVERSSYGYVARYFPIKDASGKPTTRYRLNLLFSKALLRNWYVLMD
jgi:hypothetical protein